jgi:hypothetical protein
MKVFKLLQLCYFTTSSYYGSGHSNKNKDYLIHERCFAALQQENVSADEPIVSRDTTNAVCHAVEAAFLHDLKGSSSDKNFWTLLKKFTHKSTRSQISELKQITTDIGRCRAWIRVTINDYALESYLRLIISDTVTLKHYYRPTAFMRDIEQPSIMLTYIQGLSEFAFNLSTNSTVLNQWTSTTLVLSGLLPPADILYPTILPSANVASVPRCQVIGGQLRQSATAQHERSIFSPAFTSAMSISTSCPQRLDHLAVGSVVSDSLQLTQVEIDAIRDFRPDRGSGSNASSLSTPNSMMSHPDFVDPRPDIYRFVYDISPGCQTPDRLSLCGTSESAGVSVMSSEGLDPKFSETIVGPREYEAIENQLDNEPLVVYREKPHRALHTTGDGVEKPSSGHHTRKSTRPGSGTSGCALAAEADGDPKLTEARTLIQAAEKHDCAAVIQHSIDGAVQCESELQHSAGLALETSSPVELTETPCHKESFTSLLNNYSIMPGASAMKIPTVDEIIQTLPQRTDDRMSGTTTPHTNTSSVSAGDQQIAGISDDILFDLETDVQSLTHVKPPDPKSDELECLVTMCNEKGIHQQCYQCHGCARPIGMFYGKERLCQYDGFYYCFECHENNEHYIPAQIVYNWDFRPYQVCKKNYEFLNTIVDKPLIHLDQVNMQLYEHVKALNDVMLLRVQLHALKDFLLSCRQLVADKFIDKLGGKSYLADDIHVYSLKDLTQVATGILAPRLQTAVDYGTKHVYKCILCSQKGFICELCRHAKVIYPFELSATTRCEDCKAVFHASCKVKSMPCPRCTRRQSNESRRQSDPIERISFSFPSGTSSPR